MKVYFCLPKFGTKKIVTWKYQVDESTNGRYNMILGRELITALGLDLKFSGDVIIVHNGIYEGCLSSMVGVSNCNLTSLTDKTVKPEYSFINSCVDKFLYSEGTIRSTRRMCNIIEAK